MSMDNELPKVNSRHRAGFYSCWELADMLGLAHETFLYHVKMGYVPRPDARFKKRKYYATETAEAVMDYFLSRRRYQRHEGK